TRRPRLVLAVPRVACRRGHHHPRPPGAVPPRRLVNGPTLRFRRPSGGAATRLPCPRPTTPTVHPLRTQECCVTNQHTPTNDPNIRRDYQPGTGPFAGLVWGLLAVAPLWCLAGLAVGWWW